MVKCVCMWIWLMYSSHIRIPFHPTLQCPLSPSLIAGRVRLKHLHASQWAATVSERRGWWDGLQISWEREWQKSERDASGRGSNWNSPTAPSGDTKMWGKRCMDYGRPGHAHCGSVQEAKSREKRPIVVRKLHRWGRSGHWWLTANRPCSLCKPIPQN